jgi:rhodanese-related sulfurtransferase
MRKSILKTISVSLIITAATALFAIGVNALRDDGIDLVATIPYEIFSECRDSTAFSESVTKTDLNWEKTPIYVDARPKTAFEKAHVKDAINIPYSALFGATPEDIARLKSAKNEENHRTIVVYGLYKDGENAPVDFSQPLAEQLIETGFKNVKHTNGGIEELKKQGAVIVEHE